ncbi:MAG: coproporphyrinogen dehydrogenase HemZ [Clostridia bacterium]|nr:coproporphyrinogen dehydrogenase HemZ [Clostridia bacterium]
MILHINGDINRYYVQTLCMIFFPGSTFPDDEQPADDVPELTVTVNKTETGYSVNTFVKLGTNTAECEKEATLRPDLTDERCKKIAVGASVAGALGKLLEYRPTWGVLTGVRPTKVATEMLATGMSKTRVKRQLMSDYLLYAKKANLATEVALHEQKIIGTPSSADCSIYVSIPFCPTRCQYCSFVCYTSDKLLSLIPEYIDRLVSDLKDLFAAIDRNGLNVKTVYIGGGTPSILEPDQLRKLLNVLADGIAGRNIEEFTCESGRPDTITKEKLQVIKEYGVGRISVNPQTLCEEVLQGIGRSHTVEDFYRSYNIAREVGIDAINTDLIAGLPGDTFSRFSASMEGIMALEPENITVHTFCVKRSAAWRQSNVYSLRGGDAGKCVDYAQIKSRENGYVPYYMYRQKNTVGNFENVGFSKPGYEGRYNIYMMEEVHSILSAGAGAVTKLVNLGVPELKKPVIKRIFNPKYPYEYLQRSGCADIIDGIDRFFIDNPIK